MKSLLNFPNFIKQAKQKIENVLSIPMYAIQSLKFAEEDEKWSETILYNQFKLFPARENLVSDIPAGDGKSLNFFYCVCTCTYV